MFVIIGLGNPGSEYAQTRHNIGYMVLDILAARWDIDIGRHRFRAEFGEGFVDGRKAVLAKPLTYMNESGWAARELVNWYKCDPAELIVIYDDADLEAGGVRVRAGGSAGTHNGMRSVIYQLGFDAFPRVRVGIGKAAYDMVHHVLGMPQGEEREKLAAALESAADAVEQILRGELEAAQARFNRKPKKEKPALVDTAPAAEETDGSAQARAARED